MTVSLFNFEEITQHDNGTMLSCHCLISADMPFFNGHFLNFPIMPAAAQINMIQMLLQQQSSWNSTIRAGSSMKFSRRISPGETITIELRHDSTGKINFTLKSADEVKSKGTLEVAGGNRD